MLVTRTLLLMRHGEIAANAQRRWHGATDSPLTPAGRRQALRLAQRIKRDWGDVEAIYTSPLIRCVHTAQRLGAVLGQPVILDDDLREYGIGELENTTFDALHSEYDFFRRIRDDQNYAPGGGDSINEVKLRIVGALRRIHSNHHSARPIAVVSHGAALGIALASLLDADANRWTNYHFDNCSVTELQLEPEPLIAAFNSTEHL
jgi:broad specificity phosphatase PhoE